MAVNLINSNDIEVSQVGNDIQLEYGTNFNTKVDARINNFIKAKNVSGTPDSNGFLSTGLGLNNVIVGCSNISHGACFLIPFIEKNAGRLTIKCETWDRNPITSYTSFIVYYFEI